MDVHQKCRPLANKFAPTDVCAVVLDLSARRDAVFWPIIRAFSNYANDCHD